MGGMLAATFLAIFFVPMFFKVITARKLREPRSTQVLKDEAAHVHQHAHQHARQLGATHHPHRQPDAASQRPASGEQGETA